MMWRSSALLASMAAASWFALQSVSNAQGVKRGTPDRRLVPTEIQGRIANPAFLPPGFDGDARVAVVATLAGEPVAVAQETASRRLSRAEKDRVKTERRGEQAVVRPSIEALGADVLGTYQSALNGIKVRIPRRQLAALRQIPGVVAVKPVTVYQRADVVSVPRIQAPVAWDLPAGVHGEGIKVAVIDSGIDYTHADFGGPGTVGAYATAAARSTLPADPSLFGPDAPKVKGGYDLVGDDYDPTSDDPANSPHPDPNPLDCEAGAHGSIVASSVGGFGVTDEGKTYTGPYDTTTHARSFLIGPGVAPKADLYAVRVFGCDGGRKGTRMVAEAIEWAIDNDMDVISMQDVVFTVSLTNQAGSPHTLSLSRTQVRVPARGEAQVTAQLVIPAESAGDATAFRDVAGLVTFTPASPSMNAGYALRVPYYVVPRVSSDVTATLESRRVAPGESGSVLLENRRSAVAGTADVYAWGLESKKAHEIGGRLDLHAAGVQSLENGETVVFAITTKKPWSSIRSATRFRPERSRWSIRAIGSMCRSRSTRRNGRRHRRSG